MTGPTEGPGHRRDSDQALPERALAALRAIALRAELAGRLEPAAGAAVLRSIVEATVALFGAEAASLALYDAAANRLVFRVAAGSHGDGVVGVSIPPDEGIAGYVFTSGQPIALSDVARDARFGRETAEQTGYLPRSLVAVPLIDDEGTIGVLEVLDKRDQAGFDLRDVELASVFARQATVAIRASRVERETGELIRAALGSIAAAGPDDSRVAAGTEEVDAIVGAAIDDLGRDDDTALWALADEIGRLRAASPAEIDLVRELLAVLARRAERAGDARARHRTR
ncbi:MAG TPA: GAF domain-containing protein [Candidatus Limnocylindrales bacterium]|nr:GAF domain-containing protein [Candidatus Limnocylindrales bacterium]